MEVAVGQILAGLVEELACLGRVPGHLVAVFNNHILLFLTALGMNGKRPKSGENKQEDLRNGQAHWDKELLHP